MDEVTYPWDAVPAPVWEPNWMAVPLRFGEVAVPRDALGPGGREGVERAGPVAVWIDGGAVVERGDGWEHRVAREIVTTARRVGPLVVLEGGGTGCVLEARALERSPALRALVAEVEPSG